MAKLFIIFSSCLVALSSAGFAPLSYSLSEPTITSQSSNILRSPGNLAQISTYSKTVDTPFSSSSKSDVRVSNPGVYSTLSYAAAPAQVLHAAPAVTHYAAPAVTTHYAAPAVAHYAAPAPAVAHYAAPAQLVHAAPAPAVAHYAAAPAVAHTTFTGLGYSYAW